MRRILLSILIALIAITTITAQSNPPLRIRELDGQPARTNATGLVFPNGTLNIDGGTVTVTLPLGGPGYVALLGGAYRNAFLGGTAVGDNDLYTCPVGKRALVMAAQGYNDNGTQTNVFAEVKISGTYYRISNVAAASANASFAITAIGYVLEPGEALALNSAATQVNVWARIVEYDSSVALKTVRLNSYSVGDNTLYSCPAGKTCLPVNTTAGQLSGAGSLPIFNNSGGTRTYTFYVVPAAGSPGTTNRMQVVSSSTSTTVISSAVSVPPLASEGSYVINTDSAAATQYCWVTIMEI